MAHRPLDRRADILTGFLALTYLRLKLKASCSMHMYKTLELIITTDILESTISSHQVFVAETIDQVLIPEHP